MNKILKDFSAVLIAILLAASTAFAADDLEKKLNDTLSKAPAQKFWQLSADDVNAMIKAKKTDFVVVDARPNPNDYKQGHIPGAIQIPIQDVLKPESLKKLPKDKKIILVCVTGQTQNLPVVGLRVLGYNAYTMSFGMAAWQKGSNGARLATEAIKGSETKNYPVVK